MRILVTIVVILAASLAQQRLDEARRQAAELLTPEQKASLQRLGISAEPPADMPNPMMQGKSKKPTGRSTKKKVDQ